MRITNAICNLQISDEARRRTFQEINPSIRPNEIVTIAQQTAEFWLRTGQFEKWQIFKLFKNPIQSTLYKYICEIN